MRYTKTNTVVHRCFNSNCFAISVSQQQQQPAKRHGIKLSFGLLVSESIDHMVRTLLQLLRPANNRLEILAKVKLFQLKLDFPPLARAIHAIETPPTTGNRVA